MELPREKIKDKSRKGSKEDDEKVHLKDIFPTARKKEPNRFQQFSIFDQRIKY